MRKFSAPVERVGPVGQMGSMGRMESAGQMGRTESMGQMGSMGRIGPVGRLSGVSNDLDFLRNTAHPKLLKTLDRQHNIEILRHRYSDSNIKLI